MKNASRLGALVLVGVPAVALAAKPPAPAIDPNAQEVLRGMATYLASLQSFSARSDAVDELVLTNGSKIQKLSTAEISVRRPNAIRSEEIGPDAHKVASYDGKSLGVYCKTDGTYGTVPAPPTIDGALDMAREKYSVQAPGADLFYSNPYEVLTDGVRSGQYLGLENVDGVEADHLAFQEADVDWQLWVENGPTPYPLRYVVTTKTMPSQPQFTARLSRWEPQANIPPDTFAFHAPPGAKHVAGIPTDCPATSPGQKEKK